MGKFKQGGRRVEKREERLRWQGLMDLWVSSQSGYFEEVTLRLCCFISLSFEDRRDMQYSHLSKQIYEIRYQCELDYEPSTDISLSFSSDLLTSDISTVFLYSIYAYFCSIFPSRIRYLRYLSFVNHMKNSRKAALIGFSQDQLATKRLGTWLGPVILSILLRKYDFDVGQSHPYLSHNSSTLILYVGLKYSLMIFLVIYPHMFFRQSHGFLTLIFFSLGLKIFGNSLWSLQVGAHWKIRLRSPQLGALMSSPKMESFDF